MGLKQQNSDDVTFQIWLKRLFGLSMVPMYKVNDLFDLLYINRLDGGKQTLLGVRKMFKKWRDIDFSWYSWLY